MMLLAIIARGEAHGLGRLGVAQLGQRRTGSPRDPRSGARRAARGGPGPRRTDGSVMTLLTVAKAAVGRALQFRPVQGRFQSHSAAETEALGGRLAAELVAGRRRARGGRAGRGQDDVRARGLPRARRDRPGDQPHVHHRPALSRRATGRSWPTSTSTGWPRWPTRIPTCWPTTSGPRRSRSSSGRAWREQELAELGHVAARVRLEHAGGDCARGCGPVKILGFDTATRATAVALLDTDADEAIERRDDPPTRRSGRGTPLG